MIWIHRRQNNLAINFLKPFLVTTPGKEVWQLREALAMVLVICVK